MKIMTRLNKAWEYYTRRFSINYSSSVKLAEAVAKFRLESPLFFRVNQQSVDPSSVDVTGLFRPYYRINDRHTRNYYISLVRLSNVLSLSQQSFRACGNSQPSAARQDRSTLRIFEAPGVDRDAWSRAVIQPKFPN